MAKGNGSTDLGRPGKGALTRALEGRQCDHMNCTTVLSAYNAASTCWLHGETERRHATYKTVR